MVCYAAHIMVLRNNNTDRNVLKNDLKAQVCDARKFNSSNSAWLKKTIKIL